MQSVADPPEEAPSVDQPLSFGARENVEPHQFGYIGGTELPVADPQGGVDVAQSARRGFYIGFKVVVDIVVMPMAGYLLVALSNKEFLNRPNFAVAERLLQWLD